MTKSHQIHSMKLLTFIEQSLVSSLKTMNEYGSMGYNKLSLFTIRPF